MRSLLRPAVVSLVLFTVATGLIYPAAVTVLAKLLFPSQADGSEIVSAGLAAGSALIGQPFSAPGYFWGRPSATGPVPYNGASSSGSNRGPLNPALTEAVAQRVQALRAADPGNTAPVPVDLVTASASGLDPHTSPEAAAYQVGRVARARGAPPESVASLVTTLTESRTFGLLGEPRVNVLKLNMALDSAFGRVRQ